MENYYEYYQQLKGDNVHFSFKGTISQNIMVEFGKIIKEKLREDTVESKTIKTVFSIFVEMAQNVSYYSADKIATGDKKNIGDGLIIINEIDDHFNITSGNLIKKAQIEKVTEKIEHINSLDKDNLKKFYKEQSRIPREENSKGAGLGFIFIAKKSQNPLEFSFNKIDTEHYFFQLTVKVQKK